MTDLLERVSRAIIKSVPGTGDVEKQMNSPVAEMWRDCAQAAIDAYEEWQWQPMWEAPRDGTRILLVNGVAPNLEVVEGYWRKAELPKWGEGWVSCMDADVPAPYMEPPCWRPLPAPPKGGGDD